MALDTEMALPGRPAEACVLAEAAEAQPSARLADPLPEGFAPPRGVLEPPRGPKPRGVLEPCGVVVLVLFGGTSSVVFESSEIRLGGSY